MLSLFAATVLLFADDTRPIRELLAAVLDDKIRGGLLGQILGNLNGLPHEMKYIDRPGAVEHYTPGLSQGAWTDDDTDIEWVYVTAMHREGRLRLPSSEVAALWRTHINRGIWCANRYARDLMDIGIEPPLTGRIALNPWSDFNISGQFLCESFALIAPGMPQTAARLGLHYTHVAIDGEPAQATQFFATMIASAYFEGDPEALVRAGLEAVDPTSEIHEVAARVLTWWKQNPSDWQALRQKVHDRYTHHGGAMRDRNGYELNTAATIAALLLGRGEFAETLRLAFNFGWDADNNAATCGAILGVVKGRRWMDAQGWVIRDRYENRTRDGMPADETITRFGDKLLALARLAVREQGGEEVARAGVNTVRIRAEAPGNVERLPVPLDRRAELRALLRPGITSGLTGTRSERARAAYLALCLGEVDRLMIERPGDWTRARDDLKTFPSALRNIAEATGPVADRLRIRAITYGLGRPDP